MAPSIGSAPFDRPGWIFELKYDGYRAIVSKHHGEMKMLSRLGNDYLPYFPEIAACLETLPDLVLDGELVVLDDVGRAQFNPLRRRALMRDPKRIAAAVRETPAAVFAFDLIALRGQDLRRSPLLTRKAKRPRAAATRRARCGASAIRRAQQAALSSPAGRPRRAAAGTTWPAVRTGAGSRLDRLGYGKPTTYEESGAGPGPLRDS